MSQSKIHIGTSGWSYKHWKGLFYPGDIKNADEFDYYKSNFSTVEINYTFYRLPSIKTFEKWKASVSDDFIFSLKASRYITHFNSLKESGDSLGHFLEKAEILEDKLGPILFQLPPQFHFNYKRLESFLKLLPASKRFVFEFRHKSWFVDDIYDLLSAYNCAFCIYELQGKLSPIQVTTDFVYVRLHGPSKNKYEGDYSEEILSHWADECVDWKKESKEVFIYFDNDQHAYAPKNAKELIEMISKRV